MLNKKIVVCWILVCSVLGALSYTATNLMTEFMFIIYYSLQFLFYLCVAYSNFHAGSLALESQPCLMTVLQDFVKESSCKLLTEFFACLFCEKKGNPNFLLKDIYAQFAENRRGWNYFMPIVKQYMFFNMKYKMIIHQAMFPLDCNSGYFRCLLPHSNRLTWQPRLLGILVLANSFWIPKSGKSLLNHCC